MLSLIWSADPSFIKYLYIPTGLLNIHTNSGILEKIEWSEVVGVEFL